MMSEATAPKSPTRRRLTLEADYQPPTELSDVQRAAHALDWAAKNQPFVFYQAHVLLKVIRGYAKAPARNSEDVDAFRRRLYTVGNILQEKYGRMKVAMEGAGVRASVNDADALQHALPPRMIRLAAARRFVRRAVELIDPKALPDTPDMAPWKRWLKTDVGEVMRALNSSNFDQLCLPPGFGTDRTDQYYPLFIFRYAPAEVRMLLGIREDIDDR